MSSYSSILPSLLDYKPLRDKGSIFSHLGITHSALHIESPQSMLAGLTSILLVGKESHKLTHDGNEMVTYKDSYIASINLEVTSFHLKITTFKSYLLKSLSRPVVFNEFELY